MIVLVCDRRAPGAARARGRDGGAASGSSPAIRSELEASRGGRRPGSRRGRWRSPRSFRLRVSASTPHIRSAAPSLPGGRAISGVIAAAGVASHHAPTGHPVDRRRPGGRRDRPLGRRLRGRPAKPSAASIGPAEPPAAAIGLAERPRASVGPAPAVTDRKADRNGCAYRGSDRSTDSSPNGDPDARTHRRAGAERDHGSDHGADLDAQADGHAGADRGANGESDAEPTTPSPTPTASPTGRRRPARARRRRPAPRRRPSRRRPPPPVRRTPGAACR